MDNDLDLTLYDMCYIIFDIYFTFEIIKPNCDCFHYATVGEYKRNLNIQ